MRRSSLASPLPSSRADVVPLRATAAGQAMYERAAEDGKFGSDSKSNENEAEYVLAFLAALSRKGTRTHLASHYRRIVRQYVEILVRPSLSLTLLLLPVRRSPSPSPTDPGQRQRPAGLNQHHLAVQRPGRPPRVARPLAVPRRRDRLGRLEPGPRERCVPSSPCALPLPRRRLSPYAHRLTRHS